MSELERRLLARLTDSNELSTAWEMGLRSQVFGEPICGAIFTFIEQYWNAERRRLAPTIPVIQTRFPGVDLPTDQDLSTAWMVQTVMSAYSANELQLKMMETAKLSVQDPQGAVKFLRSEMHAIAETITPRHSRSNMATNIDERARRYLERLETQSQGVTLGLPELDAHVNGLLPGELAVVGAYSKTGKTMLLCKAAIAARKAGFTPMIFTLEMPKEEIEDRLDAMYSALSYDRLIHSRLTVEEMKILTQMREELASLGDLRIESPERGDRTVATMINMARYADADYPIIDQLSHMEPGKKVRDLKEHHSVIMNDLKTEINRGSAGRVPCFLAVQFNRQSQSRREGIGLDSFANATEVEATCDLALGLWRNAEMRDLNEMHIEILGCRRAAPKGWKLNWELTNRTMISVKEELDAA